MFVRNQWYVLAWASELDAGMVARTVMDEPLVAYRTAAGEVAVLEDRCCHRALPLSQGHVVGEHLRCVYHGLEYDTGGRCVKIPGQPAVPKDFCVRRYPAVLKHKMLWVWMGAAAPAEPPPDYPYHDDTAHWPTAYDRLHLRCHYELIHDNLLDLTHLSYVHADTIGGDPEVHFGAQMAVDVQPDQIVVRRTMPGSVPPPTYARSVPLAAKVDRWQEIRFRPGLVLNYSGAVDAGTGLDHPHGYRARNLNALTPETAHSTHYFFSASHGHNTGDAGWTAQHFAQIKKTFLEDVAVLESQQRMMERTPQRPLRAVMADKAAMQARRMVQRLLDAERAAAAETARAVASAP